jgi:hypothetical protein
MSIVLDRLPNAWKCAVKVLSIGGRDDNGDPLPQEETLVEGCLLNVQDASELDNLNANPVMRATLYMPSGTNVLSTSQIITQANASVVGKWSVDGPPVHWPLGTEVRLRFG